MSSVTTYGIVIKVTDYGESDKIVTFYCPGEGKFTGIAKGAKRSSKRFVNKLELFTHLEFQYNSRYKLATIDQADLIESFSMIRTNYQKYTIAALICELLLSWTHENDGDPLIFKAVTQALRELADHNAHRKTLVLFLVHFYALLGYQPNLNVCTKCGLLNSLAGPFQFQTDSGSIVCKRCRPTGLSSNISLSIDTIKLLNQAQKMNFGKTTRLQFSDQSIKQSLVLFKNYGSFLLDRDIHSWDFIPPS